jgi:hypothetical protein
MDDLLVDMFLRGEPGIFVVLDCLQINQAKRKNAEQRDEGGAHESTTSSAIWIHVAAED